VPKEVEAKVETPLMGMSRGSIQVHFDLYAECDVKVLFLGYNLKPGIAPANSEVTGHAAYL